MDKKIKIIYYSCSGSTRRVAEAIHKVMGGELNEIILKHPNSKVTSYTLGIVDTMRGHLPKIKNHIEVDDADTIYLGSPVWGWSVSIAMKSFLKGADLSGKKVIPFCTDEGGAGDFFEKIKELTPESKYLEGHEFINVNMKNDEETLNEVKKWLFTD